MGPIGSMVEKQACTYSIFLQKYEKKNSAGKGT
jgi:hypothetical protein